MGWIARKFDNLGSAVVGGGGGMGLSQGPAYTQAYLQRLGGHLDEARRTVEQVREGQALQWMDAAERGRAVEEFSGRVTELENAYHAIAEASPMLQPLMMLRHAEQNIAARTLEHFTPALPLDPASLVYTGIGVVLALLVYETCKSPALLFRRRERRLGEPRRGA